MTEPSEEVKEVERRYEETIDKMYQLIGRLKTERMSQAEFEQYAKEHGYIISTTNIIEQIRAEIQEYKSTIDNAISEDELKIEGMKEAYVDCLDIIDKYTK